jgi:hypothetical protein
MTLRKIAVLLAAGLVLASPSHAQLIGGSLPQVGGVLPGGVGGAVDGVVGRASRLAPDGTLAAVDDVVAPYRRQARDLLRRHAAAVEADDLGQPVVRGEVAGLGISPEALQRAQAAGFAVARQETIEGLDVSVVVLSPPRGMSAREAVRRLRALDPAGRYDFNHIYFESGATTAPVFAASTTAARSGEGLRIGLVDGSAPPAHPALARVPLTQKAFAPGGARVTAHGAAVASLLAGSAGPFRGAAPGAWLFVADVYGPTPAGGSALSVARGLGWLAQMRTPVINVSLVGPPNAVLEAAVAALVARGHLIVAAVGNDGPGAAPLYPAAYKGVVAVAGVDGRRRVLPEAGRGAHVVFAAPGADMTAADLKGGFGRVRGSSFAAPLAAGLLAQRLPAPDPAAARRALEALGREALDLGAPGPDPIYGRGLVAADLATRPAALAARR